MIVRFGVGLVPASSGRITTGTYIFGRLHIQFFSFLVGHGGWANGKEEMDEMDTETSLEMPR